MSTATRTTVAPRRRRRSDAPPPQVPSEIWRRLAVDAAPREKPPRGLDAVWNGAAGRLSALSHTTRRYLREATVIRKMAPEFEDLDDAAFREQITALRETFLRGRDEREHWHRGCALVGEASLRTLGFRPHVVQTAAALCILDGCIAEMATGEGKTLAASISAVLAGWRGRGCHLVTFNDYLAARDAETMRPLYELCGLRVGHVDQEMAPADRRQAYRADVTYATSQSVAADFLRDRLSLQGRTRPTAALLDCITGTVGGARGPRLDDLVLRGLDTAIVDEADSILIDEAVTPLIISGEAPNTGQIDAFETAARIVRSMEDGEHYRVNRRYGEIKLTRAGREQVQMETELLGGLWAVRRRREELVLQALTARELYTRDHQYVIDDGKIVIVDESTGRLMPDRTWRAGLHQAVEAKEELEVNPPKETQARLSFQRFFRMYRCLGGTTGTGWEARHEMWQVYGLSTAIIPTHRPSRRALGTDRAFPSEEAKWAAIEEEIAAVHAEGRPILVGTRTVDDTERLSARLAARGLVHQVLNAVKHAEEAAIVARGGERGAITVATNMAGRGTDIKLGEGVEALGGLHVIAAERYESPRIDRQLFGRSARQGDPGSAVAFVSLEDEICRRFAPPWLHRLVSFFPIPAAVRQIIRASQRRAQRLAARQRQSVTRGDDWIDRFLGFAGKDV